MIYPNSVNAQNINASHIPQFFGNPTMSLPFAYNGAQINYRDSSWLKLVVCELFAKGECPSVENCILAHPPSTVKIEGNKVTVCYDFIKKKDCKHGNCKYYHPHDSLASAILRRGDDTKRNGISAQLDSASLSAYQISLSNMGLTQCLNSPFQMSRSQDIYGLQTQNILAGQNNNSVIADPQMKAKLEVMRQLNVANGTPSWLPGLTVAASQPNQAAISLHPLLPAVSAINATLHPIANGSFRPPLMGIVDPDAKIAGFKRVASDAFGPSANYINASHNNAAVGSPELKKAKPLTAESQAASVSSNDMAINPHYYMPVSASASTHQLQSPSLMHLPAMTNNFSILQPNALQAAPLSAYHQLNSLNANNHLLQSLLANNQNMATANHNLEAILALSGQKLYSTLGAFPQMNVAQMPLLNQIYCQQLMQNSLVGAPQMMYPGSVNIAELQQRTMEETSVAFINDKGTILDTLPVCKDFLQGKCKRSQSCNYVHLLDANVEIKDSKLTVCKNALKGQCHRPVCKFYHIPTYQLQKLGLHNQAA